MKNIYIFFVLLAYVTLQSFGLHAKTTETTSFLSSDTHSSTTKSTFINVISPVFTEHGITSVEEDLSEFDNNQINAKQSLFIDQQLNSIANYDSRLKIRLEFFTSKNYKREILLTIDERSTDAVDNGFEAVLNNDFPNDMYWVLDDEKFIIQAFGELKEDRVVPIGIKSMGDCTIQIKVATIENPYPDMEVYLRDNTTLDTYDILNGSFEIDLDQGQFNDKYSVVFEPKVVIEEENAVAVENSVVVEEDLYVAAMHESEQEEVLNEVRVFVGEYNELLRIKKPSETTLTSIAMFNMLGQQINAWNVNMNTNEIDLPIHVSRGIHLVLMDTSDGRIMKKVIVK
jgi:hypothetical protein